MYFSKELQPLKKKPRNCKVTTIFASMNLSSLYLSSEFFVHPKKKKKEKRKKRKLLPQTLKENSTGKII